MSVTTELKTLRKLITDEKIPRFLLKNLYPVDSAREQVIKDIDATIDARRAWERMASACITFAAIVGGLMVALFALGHLNPVLAVIGLVPVGMGVFGGYHLIQLRADDVSLYRGSAKGDVWSLYLDLEHIADLLNLSLEDLGEVGEASGRGVLTRLAVAHRLLDRFWYLGGTEIEGETIFASEKTEKLAQDKVVAYRRLQETFRLLDRAGLIPSSDIVEFYDRRAQAFIQEHGCE